MSLPALPTLAELGMDHLSARALAALPLAQIAWSDGEVSEKERGNIVRAAEEALGLGEEGARLLLDWLLYPPTPAYFAGGRALLRALATTPGSGVDEDMLRKVIELARGVAQASRRWFGFGPIGAAEAKALAEVERELGSMIDARAAVPTQRRFDATVLADDGSDADDVGTDGPRLVGVVIVGEGEARTKHVVTDRGLVLGSGPDADLVLTGRGVAPKHCRVFERRRRFYVQELPGSGGTWVRSERIGERRLLGGEPIRVGEAEVVFKMATRG